MRGPYVVFYWQDRELLRYTLFGECEGEREETAGLLAYEQDIPVEEIEWAVVRG